jgi:DNA (cytosine-5)-methyltransferase 1
MSHACDVIRECGQVVPALQHRMGTGGNQIPLTYQKVTGPLMANSHPGSYCGQDAYTDMFVSRRYTVRRLTPLECERLQGYPDGWTDIPGASDSARYKALGNSVAVCCQEYVLEGIKEVLEVTHET